MKIKWKRELENWKKRKMSKKQKKITKALKMKLLMETGSNTDCDQDSDISFMKDTEEKLTLLTSKEKNALNT